MSTRRLQISNQFTRLGRNTGPEFTASFKVRGHQEFTGAKIFSKDDLVGNDPRNVIDIHIHTASVELRIENFDDTGDPLCDTEFTASLCDTPVHLQENNITQFKDHPYKIEVTDFDLGETVATSVEVLLRKPDQPPIQGKSISAPNNTIEFDLDNTKFGKTEDFGINIRKRCNTGNVDGGRSSSTPVLVVVRNNNEVSKPRNIQILPQLGNTLTVSWDEPFAEENKGNQPDGYRAFLIVEGEEYVFEDNEVPKGETTININLCQDDIKDFIPENEQRLVFAKVESIYDGSTFNGTGVSDEAVQVTGCEGTLSEL